MNSTTTQRPTPDFGEPWKTTNYRDGGIVTSYDQPIMEGFKLVKRAIACVNACRGMADPAKEIEQLRRECDDLAEKLQISRLHDEVMKMERDEAREALSGRTVSCSQCNEAASKLSTVYRWIERNHPDGFIDSQSHLQNLDRVADAWHDKLQAMRDERDEARAIVSACMSAMPVGNIQTHTPENLAARIGDLASALAAETSENEAMREAIKEAHDSLLECREQLDRMTQEGIKERATNTLAKLHPLLP